MKTLEITSEIHQNWIDAEKQMYEYEGDNHPAYICHNEIGKAIYGDNLAKAQEFICENEAVAIQDLKFLEV